MLKRDRYGDGGYRRFLLRLLKAVNERLRRNKSGHQTQPFFSEHGRAMRHLHLRSAVQKMAGIGLRKIPTGFR